MLDIECTSNVAFILHIVQLKRCLMMSCLSLALVLNGMSQTRAMLLSTGGVRDQSGWD